MCVPQMLPLVVSRKGLNCMRFDIVRKRAKENMVNWYHSRNDTIISVGPFQYHINNLISDDVYWIINIMPRKQFLLCIPPQKDEVLYCSVGWHKKSISCVTRLDVFFLHICVNKTFVTVGYVTYKKSTNRLNNI